ncbi:hypothetical protein Tco_0737484 [Tanacetum coccineum]
MDDPNITMEEYIRPEEEKDRKHGKVFNWKTAKYGRIWYDENVHDLRFVETEFLAIIFNDNLTSNETLSCERTVSSLNDNEIDFRISFDESDDEDYIVVYDENSFSYKIVYVNNLKTNSENDNEKVNMPSFPSPEPEVSYFNDLDFFKEFENEFLTIVYNDALTSKSDLLTKPTISPRHIDEFDLKDETSLSECDEKEQNVLYFNDLLPFNVIYPDDLKSDTDNDKDKIDIEQPSGDMSAIPSPNVINVDTQVLYSNEDVYEPCMSIPSLRPCMRDSAALLDDDLCNCGVICEDKAKSRNSGATTKTFEENSYLISYAVSNKEDMAYQHQRITRIRVRLIPNRMYHSSPIRRI